MDNKRSARSESPVIRPPRQQQNADTILRHLNHISSAITQSSDTVDHNQEKVVQRRRLPTVNEAISWMMEQGVRKGLFGLSEGSYASFEATTVEPSPGPYTSDGDIILAMEKIHADFVRVRGLEDSIAANKPLQDSMHLELDRRILSLSSSPEITKRALSRARLIRKIKTLYELEHPTPRPNGVLVYVSLKPLVHENVQIRLPFKATIPEVYDLLSSMLRSQEAVLCQKTGESYDEETLWTYRPVHQVLGKLRISDEPAVPLLCDIDYRIMINHIARKDVPGLTSVLLAREVVGTEYRHMGNNEAERGEVSVNSNSPDNVLDTEILQDASLKTDTAPWKDDVCEDTEDIIYDKEGNPYFDSGPIDWDKFASKYSSGEMSFPDEAVAQGKQQHDSIQESQQTFKYNLRSCR